MQSFHKSLQYFEKRGLTTSIMVTLAAQAKHTKKQKNKVPGTLKGGIKMKKYLQQKYDLMSMAQKEAQESSIAKPE